MKFVLAMAMVLMMSGGAVAADNFYPQGSALVPNLMYYYINGNNWTFPYITLTNITDSTVNCRVRMYDSEANDITYLSTVSKGGSSWVPVAQGTGDFNIPPHSTRMFYLQGASSVTFTAGYAEVEWQSDDPKARKALVGGARIHRRDVDGRSFSSFLINNGQPF